MYNAFEKISRITGVLGAFAAEGGKLRGSSLPPFFGPEMLTEAATPIFKALETAAQLSHQSQEMIIGFGDTKVIVLAVSHTKFLVVLCRDTAPLELLLGALHDLTEADLTFPDLEDPSLAGDELEAALPALSAEDEEHDGAAEDLGEHDGAADEGLGEHDGAQEKRDEEDMEGVLIEERSHSEGLPAIESVGGPGAGDAALGAAIQPSESEPSEGMPGTLDVSGVPLTHAGETPEVLVDPAVAEGEGSQPGRPETVHGNEGDGARVEDTEFLTEDSDADITLLSQGMTAPQRQAPGILQSQKEIEPVHLSPRSRSESASALTDSATPAKENLADEEEALRAENERLELLRVHTAEQRATEEREIAWFEADGGDQQPRMPREDAPDPHDEAAALEETRKEDRKEKRAEKRKHKGKRQDRREDMRENKTIGLEQCSRLETELAKYVGPVASLLVADTFKAGLSLEEVLKRLASEIEAEEDRAAFLTAAQALVDKPASSNSAKIA